MSMENYTLTEVSITAVAVMTSFGSCFALILNSIKKSRCENISLCGLLTCKRKVLIDKLDDNIDDNIINP